MKNKTTYTLFTLLLVVLVACKQNTSTDTTDTAYHKLAGKTMGTTYHVTHNGTTIHKKALDSILVALNLEVSTYIDHSITARFNQSETGLEVNYDTAIHFIKNVFIAKEITNQTAYAFEPTVMPLVNYWGFGYTPKRAVTQIDSFKIDSLIQFVSFDLITIEEKENSIFFHKEKPGVQLDFSAIAKGYGVDLVGMYLEQQGIEDYMVEIGGEVRARGLNPKGNVWLLGINTPTTEAATNDFEAIAQLNNLSLATSGNYRNFHLLEDGSKYSHTINSKTGFPELNTLLSASVFTEDCAYADAYATAFMTMGLDKALTLAEQLPNVEAFFIYGKSDGTMATKQTTQLNQILKK